MQMQERNNSNMLIAFLFVIVNVFACITGSPVTGNKYNKLSTGSHIGGTLGTEIQTRSSLQCSDKCSADKFCIAYQFHNDSSNKCFLVHQNNTEGQTYISTEQSVVYIRVLARCHAYVDVTNNAELYLDFETSTSGGITVATLVPEKVGNGASAALFPSTRDVTRFTNGDECSQGPSLSAWIKIIDCPDEVGIMSSVQSVGGTSENAGFKAQCTTTTVQYHMQLRTGDFIGYKPLNSWFQLVVVFHGPSDGQGMTVFHDGVQVGSDTSTTPGTRGLVAEQMIIGQLYNNVPAVYVSDVVVDEVRIWDQVRDPSFEIVGECTKATA